MKDSYKNRCLSKFKRKSTRDLNLLLMQTRQQFFLKAIVLYLPISLRSQKPELREARALKLSQPR
jgi:hypothetical protein